jgi:hypothetical protein
MYNTILYILAIIGLVNLIALAGLLLGFIEHCLLPSIFPSSEELEPNENGYQEIDEDEWDYDWDSDDWDDDEIDHFVEWCKRQDRYADKDYLNDN